MTLSDAQRAYLDEVHYATVATINDDGSIQQTVVWYIIDGDEVRFGVGAGSVKVHNLRHRPAISVSVQDGRRYLTLQGAAVVEEFDPALRERVAIRYLGPEAALAWLQRRVDAPRLSIRVRVAKAYGQGV
jgi:PPOX class probable F420-dependent enzyme